MESLGRYLRERRAQRGMSLEELSARTRIGLPMLRALEEDDYPSLPVEVTVKGFLRSYARCLGLDEQEVIDRYQQYAAEYFQIAQDANPIGRVEQTIAPHALRRHRLTLAGLTIVALVVAISSIVALGPHADQQHPASIAIPPPLSPPIAPEAPTVPQNSSDRDLPQNAVPLLPPAEEPLAKPKPIDSAQQEITISATETTWVQVIIDGAEQKEALLQPGERVQWSAARDFRLTVGNAGGVSVEFNGEPVTGLGSGGRVRTVVLPRVAMNAPRGPAAHREADSSPASALTSPADSLTVPTQSPQ